VFHREFSVAEGGYPEAVAVRVPVKRSDGTSVTANLQKGVHGSVLTYCMSFDTHAYRDTRTVVRVKHEDSKAVSNSKKTGFSSSPMTMHPSRGSSLPVK